MATRTAAGADPGRVRRALAILPLGSTEQHGPHLPSDTDARVAAAAAGALARGHTGEPPVVLPPLAYGASGEHEAFPATVSIGTEALATVLLELGRSVSAWSGRLLVVNGHGGNLDALRTAIPRLRDESRDVAWVACRTSEHAADTHAGHAETSLLLHLDPAAVRMDRAEPGCSRPLAEILPELRAGGVAAVSANGVLGDPTGANPGDGARIWELLVADAATRLARWEPAVDGMLR